MGHRVTEAADGARALEAVARHPFPVALLDLRLGRERGIDLLSELLRLAPGLAVVIITQTGGSSNRSGLPWASGIYPQDGTPAGAAAFATWRGRPLDVVDAWSARDTWAQIDDPTWLYQRWQGKPYTT